MVSEGLEVSKRRDFVNNTEPEKLSSIKDRGQTYRVKGKERKGKVI